MDDLPCITSLFHSPNAAPLPFVRSCVHPRSITNWLLDKINNEDRSVRLYQVG